MTDNQKSKIFGIVLTSIIIIAITSFIVLGYTTLNKNNKKANNSNQTEQQSINKELGGSSAKSSGKIENVILPTLQSTSKTKEKKYLEDYEIIGKLEIPKTGLKTDILEETTKRSLEIAVTKIYTTSRLNQPGNTVIYGHNYRNSSFFSKNNELEIGDKVYITDIDENKITYQIYDKFETTSTDTSFYTKSAEMTEGKCEVTLSTCTDDASTTDRRLILLAREI